MKNSMMLIAIVALFAFGSGTAPLAADAGSRPNVILIVADDMGYNDIAAFGAKPDIQTPRLDRLASEGVRATSFYVSWPACTPSRGSILTGRYPQRNGLYDMIRNDMVDYGHVYTEQEYSISPEMTLGMDVREVVIAQVFKQAGYATGAVGKWDSGRAKRFLPLQRGFDFFYGFCNTGIDYFTHERYGVPSMFRGNERTEADKGTYATDLFRREAIRFIDENHARPFFLYLPFNAPHAASSFAGNPDKPGAKVGVQATTAGLARYPKMKPDAPLTRYYAAMSIMDDAIGAVLDTLNKYGIEQNTLVVFISDNGGAGNGGNAPLRGGKSNLYEGGLRVPFLARWPGRLPAGKTTDEFLTTLELFPTLAAAAGAPPPAGVTLDGFDMTPVLRGEAKSRRETMFWQQYANRAARAGNLKWVANEGKPEELYDLSKDLGEKTNLAKKQPAQLEAMQKRFAAWKAEMDAAEPHGPFRDY